MNTWIVIVLILVIVLWAVSANRVHEGFTTVDLNTALAQRQYLQFEGERRYNDVARVQSPLTDIPATALNDAVGTQVLVAGTGSPSLLQMLGIVNHGAADDGSNKTGASVEQTGVVQDKVAFCESLLTVNCDQLDDPRLAECGFCHRDGVNSKGKPHRGGMYISSDDQIRANEVSNANGRAPAIYKPSIGSCDPKNFTLVKENCQARELQLQCQSTGAPSANNQCGQCFGGTATGLLYVGPKPVKHTVLLNVSHPGGHSMNGAGLVVTYANGQTVTLPPSNASLLDPKQVPLEVVEGDNLTLTMYGAPAFWCGWLSSVDGKRTVSLDIGEQRITPAAAFVIAGDKRSVSVNTAMQKGAASTWASFQNAVPNTTMWYQRRDEAIPGMIVSAFYGVTLGDTATGLDVTGRVKQMAGTNKDFPVNLESLGITDPAHNMVKHIWITQDNGNSTIAVGGTTISASRLFNSMVMQFIVPATLADPMFSDDKASCPTGPLVLTEIGSGLMGSHSCFKPDGSLNVTQYCMQELFQAAGGTPQGMAFPNTDAKVAALVVNDATGKPSLDATVAALNNQGNIAIYGVDVNGAPASFDAYKAAAMAFLGTAPKNPCDGATAQKGPHTPACLDYLWKTSGNPSMDASPIDPATLGYSYCGKAGNMAPLNADGSVNQANVAAANNAGGVSGVRSFFQSVYNRTQDSSDFYAQADAMESCFGTSIRPPPELPSSCPPPNPTDWQCFSPEKLQQPEVFSVCERGWYNTTFAEAQGVCEIYNARVATPAEIGQSQQAGAQWCACSWATDGNLYYPMQQTGVSGCGPKGVNSCGKGGASGLGCVTCVGVKPPNGTPNVRPFSTVNGQWNQPSTISGISDTAVPAMREVANQVQCASSDGKNCYMFNSADACAAWTQNPASIASINNVATPAAQALTQTVDQYIRARV
jgi:hypothetical protein